MYNRKLSYFFKVTGMLFLLGCKKAYEPAILKSDNSFLVVNGLINISIAGNTTIQLSRTLKLTDTVTVIPELNADIAVESESGGIYPLHPAGNDGTYTSDQTTLSNSAKYRLNITTANGNKYASDFVECKRTPAIDSLTWIQDDGVTVLANTHDPSNNSRYYRWSYSETWEYQSQLESIWGVGVGGVLYARDSTTQDHVCWKNGESSNIVTGSSAALSQDVINAAPVAFLPNNDEKINFRYSILVKQYALTEEAYHYWQIIQKNSQELGTLFDPQPSQVNGNIHSTTNPDELVIGFGSATSQQESRLFIKNEQLTDWHTVPGGFSCPLDNTPNTFPYYNYPDDSFGPYYFITNGPLIITKNYCLDCRALGGSNQKPSFW
jgi:Domain of unknown function (DUF4249)